MIGSEGRPWCSRGTRAYMGAGRRLQYRHEGRRPTIPGHACYSPEQGRLATMKRVRREARRQVPCRYYMTSKSRREGGGGGGGVGGLTRTTASCSMDAAGCCSANTDVKESMSKWSALQNGSLTKGCVTRIALNTASVLESTSRLSLKLPAPPL